MHSLNHLLNCVRARLSTKETSIKPKDPETPAENILHNRKTSNNDSIKSDFAKMEEERIALARAQTTLDFYGHLKALDKVHLDMKPDPTLVDEFGRMFTYALLREAKDPKKVFQIERFVELHRRATEFWFKYGEKRRENCKQPSNLLPTTLSPLGVEGSRVCQHTLTCQQGTLSSSRLKTNV
ncbi:uncharacterized protein LY89DRAFT_457542 [Mollisia scopiformis]|uniref:Uncharacterized protein n=1 Tax=Mollisia scopiformis TaxID=149040 RepID=A0A194XHP5_MOLSC|nr:uncharacterized protein LY89DRAFT_457542 [Mollisia scopiformis]KUJ19656.1 hypothetical protein LY89DRAFT_457542 [Mollisia scopiformis]